MSYNPNWPRWVQASVAVYFKDICDNLGYVSLVEGLDERTTEFIESTDRIEIRVNGPFTREMSRGYWYFDVGVNILVFSHMGGSQPNAYLGTEMTGYMAQAASDVIPIFKLGNGDEDDQSQIGCLQVSGQGRKNNDTVKVFHFGEINKEDRLRQFGVDVNYEMTLYLPYEE